MVATPAIEGLTPEWFQRYARSLSVMLNALPTAPTRLYGRETVDLPPAAKFDGALMYDKTLGQVVYSDGVTWNAL